VSNRNCAHSRVSSTSVDESIVGWVRKSRFIEWNTRIALEPNFSKEAFNERKFNQNLSVIAFGKKASVENYANNGSINEEDIYWNIDPILLNSTNLGDTNPRRFKGKVFRFPLLSQSSNYYKSSLNTEFGLSKNKISLFSEIYIPKKIKGANYSAFSQVLFISKYDLSDYLEHLNDLKISKNSSIEQQRKSLYKVLIVLYRKIIGLEELGKKTSISDLNTVVQGLEKEGFILNKNLKRFSTIDLLSKEKIPDETIKILIKNYLENTSRLNIIMKEANRHEFEFKTPSEIYFWIPIDSLTF